MRLRADRRSNAAENQKREPWPGVLSTSIREPIASTMRWLIARPSPVPPRAACRVAIDLVKRLEQPRRSHRRDADAGVAHLERDAGLADRRVLGTQTQA